MNAVVFPGRSSWSRADILYVELWYFRDILGGGGGGGGGVGSTKPERGA